MSEVVQSSAAWVGPGGYLCVSRGVVVVAFFFIDAPVDWLPSFYQSRCGRPMGGAPVFTSCISFRPEKKGLTCYSCSSHARSRHISSIGGYRRERPADYRVALSLTKKEEEKKKPPCDAGKLWQWSRHSRAPRNVPGWWTLRDPLIWDIVVVGVGKWIRLKALWMCKLNMTLWKKEKEK